MKKRTLKLMVCLLAKPIAAFAFASLFSCYFAAQDRSIYNHHVSATVRARDASYEIREVGADRAVLRSIVAARIDRQWVKSIDYFSHRIIQAGFEDELGRGQEITVASTGLADQPDLTYFLRVYDSLPFGSLRVEVHNRTAKTISVQSIRSVEAIGDELLDLGGPESRNRVLSDSFSENRPALKIHDLEKAPQGLHRGVGSQLIYNLESKQSLFFGALASSKFLTIMHLQIREDAKDHPIASYTIDSTGTTEIQIPSIFVEAPAEEDRVELSLALPAEASLSSEPLMFAVGRDYHAQLEAYGAAIRKLHQARVNGPNLMGWWSWTAYYRDINEGNILTNAQWLAEHLKRFGYDYFHMDSGYEYAPGEYGIPNAARFPGGIRQLTSDIGRLGFNIGIWTAPFYAGDASWIRKQHKEWLVHNARGTPIRIMKGQRAQEGQDIFVLDSTHPGVQEYLTKTFRKFVREWGVRYIKLDFMDSTAIEGYYFRPNTSALEAQRIGLELIRKAVGDDVLLDKDGSPMLNPVGLVDEGRTSQDTAHTFYDTKEAATGIIARYYMHRNFFVSDPDAFNISSQIVGRRIKEPLTLSEAQVSIVLAAVSGGMFEIGDDLPTLGSDPERVALATNPNLLQMVRLGLPSRPLDLLTYRPEDELPSLFFLREDDRQSMLAVFNWTDQPRSHTLKLTELSLPIGHPFRYYDALADDRSLIFDHDRITLNDQPARSVRLIKIIDDSKPASPPFITARVPTSTSIGEPIRVSAVAASDGVPALGFHWDFGDGITADGATTTHTYTLGGTFTLRLTTDGVDGVPNTKSFIVNVNGRLKIEPPRRYIEPPASDSWLMQKGDAGAHAAVSSAYPARLDMCSRPGHYRLGKCRMDCKRKHAMQM
jgi:alpha-galactosidase